MAQATTILLVDDEPTIAKLFGAALEKRGYRTIVTTSPNEALELQYQNRPDLIISDVQMPKMTGFELVEHLTSRNQTTCPIMFFTADDMIRTVRDGLRAGGDDFLIKGQPMNQLLQRVSFWVGSRFRGLPTEARVRALDVVAAETDQKRQGVVQSLQLDFSLLDRASRQLRAEVDACPAGFGERLIDRIALLGRSRGLLLSGAKDLGGFVRFPDMMVATIVRLRLSWSRDVGVLLSHYDRLAEDERFVEAGGRPLVDSHALLSHQKWEGVA